MILISQSVHTKLTEWAVPVRISPVNDTAQGECEQCPRHLHPSHSL